MGLWGAGGLKNAGQSISAIISSLVGKDITVNSLTATSASTPLNAPNGPVTADKFTATGVVSYETAPNGRFYYAGAGGHYIIGNGATGTALSTGGHAGGPYYNGAGVLGALLISPTAPTVVAGAGASVVVANGTAAFTIDLGGAAQTGTITLPAATTGWVVYMQNVTTPASFVLSQTGGNTTTATFTCYSRTTGLAINWNANDVARCIAIAY